MWANFARRRAGGGAGHAMSWLLPWVVASTWLAAWATTAFASPSVVVWSEQAESFKRAAMRYEYGTHLDSVLAELERGPREWWAGSYDRGDGLGFNESVYVAPEEGAAFLRTGCLGVYGRGDGRVDRDGERIELVLEEFFGTSREPERTRLRVTRWGARRYLLAERDVIPFVNAIRAGREPRSYAYGDFFMARGDDDRIALGLPDLPPSAIALIVQAPWIAAPIGMRIESPTSIGEGCYAIASLDHATSARLAQGLEVHVTSADRRQRTGHVRSIIDGIAEVQVHLPGCEPEAIATAQSWLVSSNRL